MQKTCNRESYALSPGKELSSFLNEKRVPIIKKPIMITDLPECLFKRFDTEFRHITTLSALRYVKSERPSQRYYSLLIHLSEPSDSFSLVVRNEAIDVLRISLINMKIYEIYLFALTLPADFPVNQILVLGEDRERFIPNEEKGNIPGYCYELTVPAKTEREEYQQRILNDLNKHFKLDVRIEKLAVVKDSRKVTKMTGESVELIWAEQLTMIMKAKRLPVVVRTMN
ncbi:MULTISPECIES: hypothetical protein [Sphingobacterium]|uniref:hypothetical protein n=1 Tax=Sphingobacterium TaxID=28453 RepID=UPI001048B63B|nr:MULTISPECIES: hypothetical protein [Sphingobacterium]MCW2259602.1 hypothetical protein [Sphingobacterium kitahiroshimense]TCR13955.1 hypothetical protein EDF67_10158 [Sphingobacterium sp. JUb78]